MDSSDVNKHLMAGIKETECVQNNREEKNGHLTKYEKEEIIENGKCGSDTDQICNNRGVCDYRNSRKLCTNTRRKILLTCCIYACFAMIGAVIAQTGPALLDLQAIASVGLEEGSWLVTALYIGYTLGALMNGFLYHRCNRPIMFSVCMLGMMAAVAVIPWCRIYILMFTAHFVIGIFQGIADAAGNAEIVNIWKTSSQVALILLHSLFCVGGVISPLVIAPFLIEKEYNSSELTTAPSTKLRDVNNVTFGTPAAFVFNETFENDNLDVLHFVNNSHIDSSRSSTIYIPYSITSCICFVVSLAFVFSYFFPYTDKKLYNEAHKTKSYDKPSRKRDLPRTFKITAFGIMLSMMTICGGIANGFAALLSPFCVEFLGWSKSHGSFVTSVVYILVVVGGILGVALTKCLRVEIYASIQCVLGSMAFVILLISATAHFSIGVWLSAALYGYAKSVSLPLIIAWTNEKYFTVSGKVSSAFFVGASGGSATNPLFLGFIMETFSMKWFCYIFLIESLVLLLVCFVSVFLTRYIDKKYEITEIKINV